MGYKPTALEALLRLCDVGECVTGQGEVVSSVAFHGATHGQEVLAFHVRGVQTHRELIGEGKDALLRGTDPLPADLDHGSALKRVVQDAPTDPVAGLQDED